MTDTRSDLYRLIDEAKDGEKILSSLKTLTSTKEWKFLIDKVYYTEYLLKCVDKLGSTSKELAQREIDGIAMFRMFLNALQVDAETKIANAENARLELTTLEE